MQYFNILKDPRTKFLLAFTVVFFVTYVGLYTLGLVPREIQSGESVGVLDSLELKALETVSGGNRNEEIGAVKGEAPIWISIPKANVNIKVLNPDSTDAAVLDEYLKQGVVRYPDSALLGAGNVFLFGHSSNWEIVQNQSFKALNGIENLKEGDEIIVKADNYDYVYAVTSVATVTADEAFVDLSRQENMLTISTCNSFGAKETRHVVEAVFVKKTLL